ncbi:hypothetical protein E2C01_069770 [Portunus trituberculatus]|uniref:Uncharacterized protein n=1 Tax=Portunus trituberculatus TaxID=210409 RepID=A0A5B7I3N5_PORTR|nr:hypothetical protein [Portunus trituberculatus]
MSLQGCLVKYFHWRQASETG